MGAGEVDSGGKVEVHHVTYWPRIKTISVLFPSNLLRSGQVIEWSMKFLPSSRAPVVRNLKQNRFDYLSFFLKYIFYITFFAIKSKYVTNGNSEMTMTTTVVVV